MRPAFPILIIACLFAITAAAEEADITDFKPAYRHDPSAVKGIAIGNDSDQTRETALAWFGDFSFRTKP